MFTHPVQMSGLTRRHTMSGDLAEIIYDNIQLFIGYLVDLSYISILVHISISAGLKGFASESTH